MILGSMVRWTSQCWPMNMDVQPVTAFLLPHTSLLRLFCHCFTTWQNLLCQTYIRYTCSVIAKMVNMRGQYGRVGCQFVSWQVVKVEFVKFYPLDQIPVCLGLKCCNVCVDQFAVRVKVQRSYAWYQLLGQADYVILPLRFIHSCILFIGALLFWQRWMPAEVVGCQDCGEDGPLQFSPGIELLQSINSALAVNLGCHTLTILKFTDSVRHSVLS